MQKLLIIPAVTSLILGSSINDSQAQNNNNKLQFLEKAHSIAPLTVNSEALAWNYIKKNQSVLGINPETDLRLIRTQESLLGKHFTFQQQFNGYDIEDAQIVVSLNHKNQISKSYNHLYSLNQEDTQQAMVQSQAPLVSPDSALDKAWHALKVHGSLLAELETKTLYVIDNNQLRLVTKTLTPVEAPFGYWEHTLDARSGDIIKTRRTELSRKPVTEEMSSVNSYKGLILNRAKEVERFAKVNKGGKPGGGGGGGTGTPANGTALVFDPDPVTTLTNSSLTDSSPGSAFSAAYTVETLNDITLTSGTYSLTGPWVNIINFENPRTNPSTTSSGNWTAERGDNAFNDAMTYFQIDKNQRYIQSLGFTGAKGIQQGSIETDTDGLRGADNSHFIPSSNRMAFGHGCVDDNEDAFVILHEYGHAIQHSIAGSNWSGGDTGAMGEGFGDYWAGSYRYSTPNGASFHPAWAFPWDGHNGCWGGRNMDVTTAMYDPNQSYGAHQSVSGFTSDELWSTPLFQSLITLVGQGVPREEVDQIVLEAHFGIASGATMRDMANSIVATAQALYPNGPHAQVFTQKFQAQNILP